MADEVTISTVRPRLDKKNDCVELLNSCIQALCEEEKVTYVPNKYSIVYFVRWYNNNGYIIRDDKHQHLTKAGTLKLTKILDLSIKSNGGYGHQSAYNKEYRSKLK